MRIDSTIYMFYGDTDDGDNLNWKKIFLADEEIFGFEDGYSEIFPDYKSLFAVFPVGYNYCVFHSV